MIPEHVRAALAEPGDDRIVYDLTGIENQLDTLLAELPGVRVRFAMKACPVDEVLSALADRGAGFDAAGPGEIRSALRTGVAPEAVHYGNTVKSDADIAAAHRLGITTFATDCVEDVRAIAVHAPGARVFCRLRTGGEGALWGLTGKFGSDDPVAVLTEARRLGLTPAGLSLHVGSQQMTVRAWEGAFDLLAAGIERLAGQGITLDHVNLGGGLPAAGYPDLVPPTAAVFAAIRDGMRRLRALAGDGLGFVVEPGRYLVADHGAVRARVARLTVRGTPWLYLSCGRFNGLYEGDRVRYRLEFPGHDGAALTSAMVAGPSCDSDDTLGGGPVPVPAGLRSGDPVWIHAAGAYATSYTTVGFNGFEPPACHTVRAERIRSIAGGDWDAIAELEFAAYGSHGLSEGRAALQSRAASSPSTSFVLDMGDRVGGYLIALPYPRFRVPDLARPEPAVFDSANLHLHDIVVDEKLRGRGWARRLLRRLTAVAQAQAYEGISLVAVDGLAGFWSSHGFRPHADVPPPGGYGPDAVYMSLGI
ncbi:GNAT family N-acetyltransferase [Paractinoplanes brasiliensis]|uniref:ornithine decarboxylase n=1 Tax=Paractinoplanes brasiliensis TaxID=52695 RepID=A0A4R6JZ01_9ACTN|nr:GNAT family N-acetyltransferase [Actinoplanes brasiliensis]TDO42094.1 ornithine decarboxylase [Actinoplanes brasiliensis]GID33031.1 ornithine decarboxylase [Actinoplanes brasiliensis]